MKAITQNNNALGQQVCYIVLSRHKLMVLQHETLDFNPLASDCAAELEGVCADAAGRKDPSNGVNSQLTMLLLPSCRF